MKRIWILPALTLLLFVGCSRLNQENFSKIEDGMTMEEVTSILGEPTDSKSIGIGPLEATDATWESDTVEINIKFFKGKVQLKAMQNKS